MSKHTPGNPLIFLGLAALVAASLACNVPSSFTDIGGTALATTTWYVTTAGNDSHNCLSVANACRTIAAAVLKATGLAVIQIGAGTFTELSAIPDPSLHETITSDGVALEARVLTLRGTVSSGTIRTIIRGQGGENSVAVSRGSDITLEDLILQNGSGSGHRGLLVDGHGGGHTSATLQNVIVQGNGDSGGITIFGNASVTLDNVQVKNNAGYGVDNEGGQLTIRNSQISGNVKGVFNTGTADISATAVTGNTGAGLANGVGGTMTVEGSTVSGTRAPADGGPAYGVYNGGASMTLTNSTVSANSQVGVQTIANLTLAYSTVAGNGRVGIVGGAASGSTPTLLLENSIVENNGGQDCEFDLATPRIAVTTAGFNLSDGSCGPRGFGAYTRTGGSDAFLHALADNGGPTQTNALLPGSPAIDAVTGDCPAADQRGTVRPQGAYCDVGAYELDVSTRSLTITLPPIATPSPAPSATPAATPTGAGQPSFTLVQNANCRRGPATAYETATSFLKGQSLLVDGRSQDLPRWWWVRIPNSDQHCWVADANGTLSGAVDSLAVVAAPPLPTDTPKPQVPGKPGKFAVSNKICTSTQYIVHLSWQDVNGEAGYHVYRDGALIATLGAGASSYDDKSPDDNPHGYSVEAFNAAGSARSATLKSEGCLY